MDRAAHQMAQAAYINAQAACALIEAMGMQAANSQRPENQPYIKKDFDDLILHYGIHHNATVETLFRG